MGELTELSRQGEGGPEHGLQLDAVELRRGVLVFCQGVPAVVGKQIPQALGQAVCQLADLLVFPRGKVGGEAFGLSVLIEDLHQVCHIEGTSFHVQIAHVYNT